MRFPIHTYLWQFWMQIKHLYINCRHIYQTEAYGRFGMKQFTCLAICNGLHMDCYSVTNRQSFAE